MVMLKTAVGDGDLVFAQIGDRANVEPPFPVTALVDVSFPPLKGKGDVYDYLCYLRQDRTRQEKTRQHKTR